MIKGALIPAVALKNSRRVVEIRGVELGVVELELGVVDIDATSPDWPGVGQLVVVFEPKLEICTLPDPLESFPDLVSIGSLFLSNQTLIEPMECPTGLGITF